MIALIFAVSLSLVITYILYSIFTAIDEAKELKSQINRLWGHISDQERDLLELIRHVKGLSKKGKKR